MNLLIISTWFPFPPTNGAKLRAYHLLKNLAASHRIRLLTFAEPGEEAGASALRAFCDEVCVVPGNPAKAPATLGLRGLLDVTPRSYAQGYSEEMQRLVDERASQADAAVALQIGASLYVRSLRIPKLVEEVEVTAITQKASQARGLKRLRHMLTSWKLARFIKRLASEVDHVTVVSEPERQAVIAMGGRPDRVSVAPNGADASDLDRPLTAPRPATAVYSGALTYSPNYDAVRWFLLEIWPIVVKSRPEARFVVTGSTTGVDLASLPKAPCVEFVGFVDDIKSLVAASAVCVVPLRAGGGTRLKVLEALALGTPVVSTSKGVEGLDVEHGRHALIADSPEAFASDVLRVFNDATVANGLRAEGRALVERRYTWPWVAHLLSTRLEQIAR